MYLFFAKLILHQKNMDKENCRIENVISKSFSGMLFLLFLMMLTDITECGIKNDFTLLHKDPGVKGLYFISAMTIINVLLQVTVFTIRKILFRKVVFLISILYTLFFIIHQVIHLRSGEGIDIHFFLDLTHHILGILAIIYSYNWKNKKISKSYC